MFKKFGQKLQSRKGKVVMGYVYGWGAAVVLIGALFKLTHWLPGQAANIMLAAGLTVEALIFILSSFEAPHMEPDWSLVYPELAEDGERPATERKARNTNATASTQLDEMFAKANINEQVLERLGAGINKLSENAAQMAEISSAVAATSDYAKAMKKAAEAVGTLEIQLQNSAIFVETNNKLNKTMSEYIEKVNASATSTEALNHQIADLSKRMTALNAVYGNMLSAMGKDVK
ncbi:MAG: gliding motility protein GldL [Bacteroidales bacterium]|nr:gliding motility protein GldL [Bacteroidales bacterium]